LETIVVPISAPIFGGVRDGMSVWRTRSISRAGCPVCIVLDWCSSPLLSSVSCLMGDRGSSSFRLSVSISSKVSSDLDDACRAWFDVLGKGLDTENKQDGKAKRAGPGATRTPSHGGCMAQIYFDNLSDTVVLERVAASSICTTRFGRLCDSKVAPYLC
jgi:hypothetical protein